jgi:DNA (cytosine-5)-methyltransferase 1
MRIGSLFSGAAGLDRAVQSVFGGEVVWFSEIDKAASKVLAHRFPGVPNLGDINQINWVNWKPMLEVDILCGGFPCTDVSAAGKRAGMHGTRSGLWTEFAKAIDILRPRMVVIENVRGLLSAHANRPMESDDVSLGDGGTVPVLRAAGAVLGDLADLGYDACWATVSAASVGAPHRRERVFIVATATECPSGTGRDAQQHDLRTGNGSARESGVSPRGGAVDSFNAPHSSRIGWDEGRPEPARIVGGSDAAVSGDTDGRVDLLPTPRSSDCFGAGLHGDGGIDLRTTVTLLPTPRGQDGNGYQQHPDADIGNNGHTVSIADRVTRLPESSWGKYEPAIRRWENLTRPAPAPTEPNKNGNPRLSAAFSEWLMGWPAGWVTDPAIGISRNDQLRIVGNGVVSIQAAVAMRQLLAVTV